VRTAKFVAEHAAVTSEPHTSDPRLGADESRAAWELLDGGRDCPVSGGACALRAYSTAQANRQTVIQSRAGTAAATSGGLQRGS